MLLGHLNLYIMMILALWFCRAEAIWGWSAAIMWFCSYVWKEDKYYILKERVNQFEIENHMFLPKYPKGGF